MGTVRDGSVPPAYLNDALNYSVPDPPRECAVHALLWRHETDDGVWYLPSSPLQIDAEEAATHALGVDGEYRWIRRLTWVIDGLLDQRPDITDIILDLPPGTWGFAHEVLVLAGHGGEIIALMDLTLRDTLFHRGKTMIIEDLIVDGPHQRQGIGRQLVEHAERIAGQRGCRGIELSSDLHREDTHLFWEALGYERKAYQFRKTLPK